MTTIKKERMIQQLIDRRSNMICHLQVKISQNRLN